MTMHWLELGEKIVVWLDNEKVVVAQYVVWKIVVANDMVWNMFVMFRKLENNVGLYISMFMFWLFTICISCFELNDFVRDCKIFQYNGLCKTFIVYFDGF